MTSTPIAAPSLRVAPTLAVLCALAATPAAGRAAPDALPPAAGRLDRLAVDLAGRLGPALEGRRVPSLVLLLQVRQPPGVFGTGHQRLVTVLAPLLATRLGALGLRRVASRPAAEPEAAVLDHGVRGSYHLTLLVELVETGGRLHLRGRLYDTDVTLWGRLKGGRARLLTHLHVSTPVDAELRSYLQRPAPTKAISCTGATAPLGAEAFFAAALGDVDGDGRAELVLLGGQTLWIQRWSTVYLRFDTVARLALGGPPARVRPRFPLASLTLTDLDGDRRLDILARSSQRGAGVVVAFRQGRFHEIRRVDGYPVGEASLGGKRRVALAYPLAGRAEWNGRAVAFLPAARWGVTLAPVLHGLRFASFDAPSGPKGAGRGGDLVATVDRQGRLEVLRVRDGGRIHRQEGAGSALALGDLDGDGRPEVITSTAQPFGTSDALAVHALGRSRPLCQVKGFEGSVTALAVGDVRGSGAPHAVAVVWNARLGKSFLLVVR